MKLAITQRRSAIGRSHKQQETIRALGIKRLHYTVIHNDSPHIRGMVNKVSHLVEIEERQEG
ncbi:MAG: 50S ribosomal protein L30 [Candidatus Latescibacterota bacterium]|nr:50S ribosomal protein L30 [Candidatus Latescibacterota bacterium]